MYFEFLYTLIWVCVCPYFKTSVQHCNLWLWYIKALQRWRKRMCVLYALPNWPIRHLRSFWWLLWFNNFSCSKQSFCLQAEACMPLSWSPFYFLLCVSPHMCSLHGHAWKSAHTGQEVGCWHFGCWEDGGVCEKPCTLLSSEQKEQAAGCEILSCPFTVVQHGVLMSGLFQFFSIGFCMYWPQCSGLCSFLSVRYIKMIFLKCRLGFLYSLVLRPSVR